MCSSMQPDRTALLARLLRERILILDGAWGTMIQERKLGESDFRGPAACGLHDHGCDLKGNKLGPWDISAGCRVRREGNLE